MAAGDTFPRHENDPYHTLAATVTTSAQQKTELPAGSGPSRSRSRSSRDGDHPPRARSLSLTADEQSALKDLLEAGNFMQKLYEEQLHHQAAYALDRLKVVDIQLGQPKATQNLLQLYRLHKGPIAATLTNEREAFLPVDQQRPQRNMYPLDATKEEIDAFLAAKPVMRDEILGERTVVRRATKENIGRDLQMLNVYAELRALHPEEYERLREARQAAGNPQFFYAIPYAIAYADALVPAFRLLNRAATSLQATDPEFARYLRNRARDLLSNDYESGDASWVTGRFNKFNAQIGAYETYDDALYGVKAFHSMSILIANRPATDELRKALGGLQAIEDALPYEQYSA
jgi:hypothetical protein